MYLLHVVNVPFACCQCTFCLLSMYLLHAGNATFSFRIWRIAFLSIRWHYLKYSSIRIFIDPYSTVREKTRQWKLVFWHYWYRVKKCFWYHKTRSSRPKMFFKKCVFENFAKFTRKHLFFKKKRDSGTWHRCFPESFVKFLRTPYFTEHFCWLLLTRAKPIEPGIFSMSFDYWKKQKNIASTEAWFHSFMNVSKGKFCMGLEITNFIVTYP